MITNLLMLILGLAVRGIAVWLRIADSLEENDGRLYWVVAVEPSPEPAFVRWKPSGESKEQKRFCIREGPQTTDLDNESTWHYIRNRWG